MVNDEIKKLISFENYLFWRLSLLNPIDRLHLVAVSQVLVSFQPFAHPLIFRTVFYLISPRKIERKQKRIEFGYRIVMWSELFSMIIATTVKCGCWTNVLLNAVDSFMQFVNYVFRSWILLVGIQWEVDNWLIETNTNDTNVYNK